VQNGSKARWICQCLQPIHISIIAWCARLLLMNLTQTEWRVYPLADGLPMPSLTGLNVW